MDKIKWKKNKIIIIKNKIFHNTNMLLGKNISFTPDEAKNLFCLVRILTLCHIQL